MREIIYMHAWAFRQMGRNEGLWIVLWRNWHDNCQTAWRYYYDDE